MSQFSFSSNSDKPSEQTEQKQSLQEATYLQGLNEQQKKACVSESKRLLILAGAGSGKTKVLICRIAHWVHFHKINPSNILALTFTNKAAKEMSQRLALYQVGSPTNQVMVKTFHSFGAWLLRHYGEHIGLDRHFSIYDDSDCLRLFKNVVPHHYEAKELKKMYRFMCDFKEKYYLLDQKEPYNREVLNLLEVYQKALEENRACDFSDLIIKTAQLLRQPQVQAQIQERFPFILVDEYQDTNDQQFFLLKQLVGQDSFLTVVGDEDQSIYAFRGARVDHILEFKNYFPGTTIIPLEQNYRSSASILAVAGDSIRHNKARLGKTLWTDGPEGQIPQVYLVDSYIQEAEWAVQLAKKNPQWHTAILYRTNAQSRVFETILNQYQVPYELIGSLRFYERQEVKDILAYMQLIINPNDQVAFFRALNQPTRGLGKSALAIIEEHKRPGKNYIQTLTQCSDQLSKKAQKGAQEFLEFFQQMEQALEQQGTLSYCLEKAFYLSGLYQHYQEIDQENHSFKVDNMKELLTIAEPYAGNKEGLMFFLEGIWLDSNTQIDNPLQSSSLVHPISLITVHNTKGLEFDQVILTGLDNGVFPQNPFDLDEIEEERRLFYVAVTRARKSLIMFSATKRMLYGQTRYHQNSIFLQELDKTLVKTHNFSLNKQEVSDTMDSHWSVGMAVYQQEYGAGRIIDVWEKQGQVVIMVRFESGQRAQFMPEYTYIEKLL